MASFHAQFLLLLSVIYNYVKFFFTVKLGNVHKQKIQQNTAEILRNKQLITFLWLVIVTFSFVERTLIRTDFDYMLL